MFENLLILNVYIISLIGGVYTYIRVNLLYIRVGSFKQFFEGSKVCLYGFYWVLGVLQVISLLLCPCPSHTSQLAFSLSPGNDLLLFGSFLLFYAGISLRRTELQLHQLFGIFLLSYASSFLLKVQSLLDLYILVELFAYISLFLVVSGGTVVAYVKPMIKSALYLFLLNFFSSILMFVVVAVLSTYTPFLPMFGSYQHIGTPFIVFTIAVFSLKFGLGPWLYFGAHVYKGLNLVVVGVLTVFYCLVLIPKVYNLILAFNVGLAGICTGLIFCVYTVFLFYSGGAVKSTKVFLAYSTSITSLYSLLLLVGLVI